jgi:hypothetical protein
MDSNDNSNPAYRLDPSMMRVLNRLPREMVEKFSEPELVALYRAISRPSKHAVDLRFSLPFLPKQLYFVLLIGQDQRQGTARADEQKSWTPATTAFAMVLGLATLLTVYSVTYRLLQERQPASVVEATVAPKGDSADHPTALPWIEKMEDCRGKTRHWKDGLCFESDHDRSF